MIRQLASLGRFLVVDLETTCWPKDEYALVQGYKQNETIEIGACIYEADQDYPYAGAYRPQCPEVLSAGVFKNTWQHYIRPKAQPQLSEFCKQLTNISQDQIDFSEDFPTVWEHWQRQLHPYKPFVFTSWGDFDYYQLKRDLDHNKLGKLPFALHLNLKAYFLTNHCDLKVAPSFGLNHAVQLCGLEFKGKPHSGLDDAINTARILDWCVKREWEEK